MKFLLVEDEPEIAELVLRMLRREHFVVDHAPDFELAREAMIIGEYDLIVLDRRLPDGDGIDLVRVARDKGISSRFLILSALGDIEDRVQGLDLGADDYIVKPFEPMEFLARIRAALRRPLPETDKIYRCGRLAYHESSRNLTIDEEPISFTLKEMTILELLLRAGGKIITRNKMEESVYGYDDEIASNTLESHISRARKRLASADAGVTIHAVRGVGYMMKEV